MKLLREPLVHFLLLGAALFGLFAVLGRTGDAAGDAAHRIDITAGLQDNLTVSFARSMQRPPTPAELQGLIDDFVREEVLNREARKLGLDQDDPVVRRRLRQRMEFLTAQNLGAKPPADAELQAFFDKNPAAFKRPDGRLPGLAEVRDEVVLAWQDARNKEAVDADYRKLREAYTVTVEPAKPAEATKR